MKRYETFIFDRYSFDPESGRVELLYSLDDQVHFVETLHLPPAPSDYSEELVDRCLFLLHLAGGVSYYKTCCPPSIDIRSGKLSEDQSNLWSTIYTKGLGQFFYENNLPFAGLINFPAQAKQTPKPLHLPQTDQRRALVPMGGGKDSIVTAELLRRLPVDITLFRVGAHPLIEQVAQAAGLPLLTVEREISPALLALNEEGALNGHVPITAYLSCLSVLIAVLQGFDTVVFSNERSASEGNLLFHGEEINHQWSKSLEFERLFRQELQRQVAGLEYLSLIRPLSELTVAELFAQTPEYLPLVTSCNANWRIVKERPSQRWCLECPKCAFVFLLMAPFFPEEQLTQTFGGVPLESEQLLPLYRELLGLGDQKPFECVGTPEETQAAFLLLRKQQKFQDTAAARLFTEESLPHITNPDQVIASARSLDTQHCIPPNFLPALDATL